MLNTTPPSAVIKDGFLPSISWRAFAAVRSIGVLGCAGLVLLLCTLLWFFGVVLPLGAESAGLREKIVVLQLKQSLPQDNVPSAQTDPVKQLQEFYQFFPQASQVSDDLAKLHAVAKIHHVQLEQGNYRMVEDRVGNLLMYEISLPVKGDYPQLRKFMSQALTDIAHLGLDSVLFQRQKVGDPMLESQLKFTLYLSEVL
jgi:hypothetical protein